MTVVMTRQIVRDRAGWGLECTHPGPDGSPCLRAARSTLHGAPVGLPGLCREHDTFEGVMTVLDRQVGAEWVYAGTRAEGSDPDPDPDPDPDDAEAWDFDDGELLEPGGPMTSAHLRALAAWIDLHDAPGSSAEVQADLRRWADQLEERDRALGYAVVKAQALEAGDVVIVGGDRRRRLRVVSVQVALVANFVSVNTVDLDPDGDGPSVRLVVEPPSRLVIVEADP